MITVPPQLDAILDSLISREGGYVNDPNDPGGETNWGITVAVAREYGYSGEMKEMSVDTAKQIYASKYWLPEFNDLPFSVAVQVFDAAVHSGVDRAVRWLQQALGVAIDGKLGKVTKAAAWRAAPLQTILALNAERLMFLTTLPAWGTFGKGWARRIAELMMRGSK